jgi:hypothetical protein
VSEQVKQVLFNLYLSLQRANKQKIYFHAPYVCVTERYGVNAAVICEMLVYVF